MQRLAKKNKFYRRGAETQRFRLICMPSASKPAIREIGYFLFKSLRLCASAVIKKIVIQCGHPVEKPYGVFLVS
jgi:hypothetical protein